MEWNYRICNSGDKVPILLYELSKHLVTINFCSKLLRLQIVVIKKTRPTDVGILLYFFKQYLKTTTYALDFFSYDAAASNLTWTGTLIVATYRLPVAAECTPGR